LEGTCAACSEENRSGILPNQRLSGSSKTAPFNLVFISESKIPLRWVKFFSPQNIHGGEIMKVSRYVLLVLSFIFLASILPILGYAADQDRQALESLITDLDQKIKEWDQKRGAHPKFLEELKSLVKQYRSRLRVVYLSEDFSDGNYLYNPAWVVDSGRFQVTGSRRLLSEVFVEKPAPVSPSKEKTSSLGVIFKEILKKPEEEKTADTPSAPQEARIHTLVQIGPEFEIDLNLVSRSSWGSMEVVLLGGSPPIPLYRMIYRPSPSAERPIEVVRERDGKSFLIDTASQYPSLDDGATHRLQWMRDSQGKMRVMVDGKDVLATYEIYYRDNFTGLALVNKGGTYEWGPILVFKAQEIKTQ